MSVFITFEYDRSSILGDNLRALFFDKDNDRDPIHDIYFTIPKHYSPHNDCVGAALSCLVSQPYGDIALDFPVSKNCAETIERIFRCNVQMKGDYIAPRKNGNEFILNFSGGFDSLSAYLLSQQAFRPLSIDFGPPFEREANFFRKFSKTVTCATDFRRKGLAQDWRFMFAPSLLYADYFEAGGVAFGSIMEATEWNFSRRNANKGVTAATSDIAAAAGLNLISPVLSITEFGTAIVLCELGPSYIESSLASLGGSASEKLFRKRMVVDCARDFLSGQQAASLDRYPKPLERISCGSSFTLDFLSYYFVVRFGKEQASKWIDNLDALDCDGLSINDLQFYFKSNPNLVLQLPADMRSQIMVKLMDCGIMPYTRADWEGFDKVQERLSKRWPAIYK